ncbi:MAG: hypothetical protein ACETWG_07880 [Candidatus Neomarinimicrobiota bacterium]
MIRQRYLPILSFLLALVGVLTAGETGKIAGRVEDGATQEPLIGANVLVSTVWIDDEEVELDAPPGAATDQNGEYFILNIPPAQYTVRVFYNPAPVGPFFDARQVVTMIAVADTGWEFSAWSGDVTGSTNPTMVTMDADKGVGHIYRSAAGYRSGRVARGVCSGPELSEPVQPDDEDQVCPQGERNDHPCGLRSTGA